MAVSKEALKMVDDFIKELIKEMQGIMDTERMNATGGSRASFASKSTSTGGIMLGPSHIVQLEEGRGPTKAGGSGSLKDQIADWARAKGITPSPDANGKIPSFESLVFLITRAIHQKGTKRHQDNKKSGILSKVLTPERLKKFYSQVSGVILKDQAAQIFSEISKVPVR